jgi:hypothetical protein
LICGFGVASPVQRLLNKARKTPSFHYQLPYPSCILCVAISFSLTGCGIIGLSTRLGGCESLGVCPKRLNWALAVERGTITRIAGIRTCCICSLRHFSLQRCCSHNRSTGTNTGKTAIDTGLKGCISRDNSATLTYSFQSETVQIPLLLLGNFDDTFACPSRTQESRFAWIEFEEQLWVVASSLNWFSH